MPDSGSSLKTTSLHRRQNALADSLVQRDRLAQLNLSDCKAGGDFDIALGSSGWPTLTPAPLEIFQINLGKLCNMTCKHCHVDAGPDRTRENMDRETIDACLRALDQTTAHTVDLTGGAPELNPHFRYLVDECVARGKQVIDRCNLTVLLLPGREDLPQWFADRSLEVVCSLPHYRQRNTDAQRGDGTYERSIEALRRLNAVGYGQGDPRRRLTLVTNPVGALLATNQAKAEKEWQAGLLQNHGVRFDRLIALNNMPISRFLDWLETSGNLQRYLETLTNAFNAGTIEGLMCRNTLSVSWDGRLFDCDFNQMLDLELRDKMGQPIRIQNCDFQALTQRRILTGRHCFGCTAGAGSSCGGAIAS
jgi:radical SAM/Cys-rich protein